MPVTPALLMSGVRFSYGPGRGTIAIQHFEVSPGEKVFLYGPSGVGKSTLLGLAAGTLTPREGEVAVLGHDFHSMAPAARDRVRADSLGIVFQLFNLIPYLSVFDNVLLPCRFSKARRQRVEQDGGMKTVAGALLSRLGLD
ncbi:MAG: ATP-binding cassette domain-containing protein, partial [Pseudomonadota bacterium]